VDGFDQDEGESKRDERAVILGRLLASERNTLEALELADRLFDACPRFVGKRCADRTLLARSVMGEFIDL
jgi:hypothetical protein